MESDPSELLAAAVRARRFELGLSQRELALLSGVSLPTISLIENSRQSSYKPFTLHRLGSALGWGRGEFVELFETPNFDLPAPHSVNLSGRALMRLAKDIGEEIVVDLISSGRLESEQAPDELEAFVRSFFKPDTDDPDPDDDPATPAAQRPPLELAALSGKIEQLSDDDLELIESMIDRMLEGD